MERVRMEKQPQARGAEAEHQSSRKLLSGLLQSRMAELSEPSGISQLPEPLEISELSQLSELLEL